MNVCMYVCGEGGVDHNRRDSFTRGGQRPGAGGSNLEQHTHTSNIMKSHHLTGRSGYR
jgi:hypothetical protein